MATMHDVARKAGVSQSTVSRVLNDGALIADETRTRVLRAMDELSYRPHLGAQALKNKRSRQVGVLVENAPSRPFTHPLAWEFVLGINAGLEAGGHIMSLVRLTDVEHAGGLGAHALRSQLLDGLIVVNHVPPSVEARVDELFPRAVWLDGNAWRDENCLRRDEENAGEVAVRELWALGYRDLLFLGANTHINEHYSFAQREAGVRRAARELGMRLDVAMRGENEGVSQAFARVRERLTERVALLVPAAYDAGQILFACARSQLEVGRDFALACCDEGFHDGALSWDSIARVSFDRFAMGRQAAEMLLRALSGEDCPSLLVRGEWKRGETCRALKVETL